MNNEIEKDLHKAFTKGAKAKKVKEVKEITTANPANAPKDISKLEIEKENQYLAQGNNKERLFIQFKDFLCPILTSYFNNFSQMEQMHSVFKLNKNPSNTIRDSAKYIANAMLDYRLINLILFYDLIKNETSIQNTLIEWSLEFISQKVEKILMRG